jgi:hypothetical protein
MGCSIVRTNGLTDENVKAFIALAAVLLKHKMVVTGELDTRQGLYSFYTQPDGILFEDDEERMALFVQPSDVENLRDTDK